MGNQDSIRAWGALFADVLAGGGARFGSMGRNGAMLEADRILGPRLGDYGSGWAGEGVQVTARLSDGGHQYFNRQYHTGRMSWPKGGG